MSSSSSDVAAASAEGSETVGAPAVAPLVTAGPIIASSLGGVPFIGVQGRIDHFSGPKLAQFIRTALTKLDLAIDPPD
ncbi:MULTISPECIES: hypothetical protein [Mycolicibacter]|uniref:Uncharacterized protein n=2 Tax=Mycolicibacter TaxID=1073531 RepID=A0ABU5XL90_9MYCO|nr:MULTISPECIES: hypothetical protein [unclassified Mycolicibacter]MEB3022966.1 hypothetical protein [Mycolicibacter sp. MYC098]MEB3033476.1 hypothetical protein [Mycolicibacter sp. MYC340]